MEKRKLKISNIDELKKLTIDNLTEKLIELHKSLIDERRLSGDLLTEIFADDKLVKSTADRLIKELKHHIYKEEQILFPYLINLSKSFRKEIPFEKPYFNTVKNPIEILKSEHELISDSVYKLKQVIIRVQADSKHKNPLSEKLKDFLEDVEKVIYLENRILFPRALEIEKSLLKQ